MINSHITEQFHSERLNLNPGTMGSPSREVREAALKFYEGDLAAYPLGQYLRGRELLKSTRALAAQIWDSDPQALAIFQGGTTAILGQLAMALYAALATELRRPIIVACSGDEHSGGVHGFASHPGFEVVTLGEDVLFNEAHLDAIRPDIVFVSHITYTGKRYPVEDLARRLHGREQAPLLIVDAAQSLGLLPELPIHDADLVVGSAHKWLFGPPGTGLCWMSRRMSQKLQPYFCNGFALDMSADLGSFEASGGQDFSKLAGLHAALSLYLQTGPLNVSRQSESLARYFLERAKRIFPLVEWTQTAGILVAHFVDGGAYPLYAALNAKGIHTKLIQLPNSKRQLWRLGFPYYEATARLDRALDEIERTAAVKI